MFEYLDTDLILVVLIFIVPLTLVMIAFPSRRKTEEIFVTDKEEFLKKINLCLFQLGYNLESNRDDFITYKRSYVRVGITFNQNIAMIIGPVPVVDKLMKLYRGKKA